MKAMLLLAVLALPLCLIVRAHAADSTTTVYLGEQCRRYHVRSCKVFEAGWREDGDSVVEMSREEAMQQKFVAQLRHAARDSVRNNKANWNYMAPEGNAPYDRTPCTLEQARRNGFRPCRSCNAPQ